MAFMSGRNWCRHGFVALATAAASGVPAMANDAVGAGNAPAREADDRRTAYDAGYFAQFAPVTALDIVSRVPGFLLDEGNGALRGFSGAAGNVVVNGARPSSKSESVKAVLARIPASRVLRIEVGPGDGFGADYAGRSQVANVVLSEQGGLDGNSKLMAATTWNGWVTPDAEVSLVYKRGADGFSFSAGGGRNDSVEEGYDRLYRLSDGALVERRRKVNRMHDRDPYVSLGWSREQAADRAAHLSLRFMPRSFDLHQTNHVMPAAGPERDDRLTQRFRSKDYEASGDLTRPLWGGAIKLVGIAGRKDQAVFDTSYNILAGTRIGGNELSIDETYEEALGRISWSKAGLLGFTFEAGSEVAWNRLRNATDVWAIARGGQRTRIDLPVDDATVGEVRTESFLNLGRQATRALRIDATLAFETSRLKVTGDTRTSRSLRFWKPGLTFDWKGGGWHAQASLTRKVAQLDFHDFLARAEFGSGQINGGNAELRPQRSWEARFTMEHPMLGDGLAKLEIGHDRISGLQDRVLTAQGFDAPGNLGSGKRSFATLTLDAPLARLGAKSLRLRLDGTVQRTRVLDPVSRNRRAWSDYWPRWQWSADLRRDKGAWAFGAHADDRGDFRFFRVDEVDENFNTGPWVSLFAEYRPDRRTTLRIDAKNVTEASGSRKRWFSAPNRAAPAPWLLEKRDRNNHVGLVFSLSRSFG